MPRPFLVVLTLLLPLAALADQPVGTLEIASGSGFSYQSSSIHTDGAVPTDVTTFNLDAAALCFVAPRVALGAGVSYLHQTISSGGNQGTSRGFAIAPAVAVEVPVADDLALQGLAQLGLERQTYPGGTSAGGFLFGVAGQLKYFVTRSLALEVGLKFSRLEMTADVGPGASSTNQLSAGIGFAYYLQPRAAR